MPSIDATIAFLKEIHTGQLDKSGLPCWHHPVAVMHRLPRDVSDDVRLAALLHDVVEDVADYDRARLQSMGYSKTTLDIVELLTKDPRSTQPYIEKTRRIIDSGNRGAMEVKFADMSENSDPKRLSALDAETSARMIRKYAQPLRMLKEALNRSNPLPSL